MFLLHRCVLSVHFSIDKQKALSSYQKYTFKYICVAKCKQTRLPPLAMASVSFLFSVFPLTCYPERVCGTKGSRDGTQRKNHSGLSELHPISNLQGVIQIYFKCRIIRGSVSWYKTGLCPTRSLKLVGLEVRRWLMRYLPLTTQASPLTQSWPVFFGRKVPMQVLKPVADENTWDLPSEDTLCWINVYLRNTLCHTNGQPS